ncbi:MAG TPA: GNAT family N-acetyltransferase [Casimicrobiaceae bacterium]|nr:GNAT family N-acetyltransferase [Casimicrobiaceae bacterium]
MTRQRPEDIAQRILWRGRSVWLRQLRADDSERYAAFQASLDSARRDRLVHIALAQAEQIAQRDSTGNDADIVFAAIASDSSSVDILGIALAIPCSDANAAEIAIVLRPDVEGHGLGRLLMGKLVNHCRDRGLRELVGYTRSDNRRMIELGRAFRFVVQTCRVPEVVSLRLRLQPSAQEE